MARLHQRVAAVALLVLFAVAGAFAQGEVVTLTDDTFEHQTQASSGQTTGAWFVKFYAPWCGHCRAMAGTWAELAAEVEGTGVIVADVDATANPITTDRFKGLVKGFPTLLLFRDRGVFVRRTRLESLRASRRNSAKSEKHDVPEPQARCAVLQPRYQGARGVHHRHARRVRESGKTATRTRQRRQWVAGGGPAPSQRQVRRRRRAHAAPR